MDKNVIGKGKKKVKVNSVMQSAKDARQYFIECERIKKKLERAPNTLLTYWIQQLPGPGLIQWNIRPWL